MNEIPAKEQFCDYLSMEYNGAGFCYEIVNDTYIQHEIIYKDGKVYWVDEK